MGQFLDYIKNTKNLFSSSDPCYEGVKEDFLKSPQKFMKDWPEGKSLATLNYLFHWRKFVERTGLCLEDDIRSVYEMDFDPSTNRFYQLLLREPSPSRPLKNYFPEIIQDV